MTTNTTPELTDQTAPMDAVNALVEKELGLPPGRIDPALPLSELPGADSVKLVRVVSRLERLYDLEFEDDDVFAVKTADDLVALVDRQRDAA
jgi:acyl carrier protein